MSEELLPYNGHPLQILGERLAHYLDDDKWNECEHLLLQAWNTRPDIKPYKYAEHSDWWAVFGKIFDFDKEEEESSRSFFNAARELKEKP